MRLKYLRYTLEQMRNLGYQYPDSDHLIVLDSVRNREELDEIVKGQFKNIIDVLFSSRDGTLDNVLAMSISENAPQSVKTFIQNVLMCDVQALQSAPDDDTAFETLIPRHAQTSSELEPYIESLRGMVSDARVSATQPESSSNPT